jgi:hypothetical protein
MFAYIDPIIFPDECRILQVSADRYVYPIFKNGSSSLKKTGYRQVEHSELANLEVVEVFLRDPLDRYVSGVQTYLLHLGSNFDRDTILHMIDQYLFLNRHFCLQFHWLINLSRYTQARIRIRSMNELDQITNLTWNVLTCDAELSDRFKRNAKLGFYLELDRILLDDFMGQTVYFKDIVAHIKYRYPVLYDEILGRSQLLCSVLD